MYDVISSSILVDNDTILRESSSIIICKIGNSLRVLQSFLVPHNDFFKTSFFIHIFENVKIFNFSIFNISIFLLFLFFYVFCSCNTNKEIRK